MTTLRVHLALLLVQLLFGLWPVAGTVLMREITPAAVIGFRLALGAPVLALAGGLLWRKLPARRDLWLLAAAAGLGISINQLLFVEGLHRSDPVNASVAILLLPALTLVIATVIGQESPSRLRLLGVAIALAGGALLVHVERFDLSDRTLVGNLLLLGNVTAYAGFLVLARPVFQRVGGLAGMAWCFVFGGIEALPFTLGPTRAVDWFHLTPTANLMLAFVFLGPTLGSYVLNAYALRRAESSLVAVYTNVQPVVAATTQWLLFRQAPAPRTLLAAAVISVGITLSADLWRLFLPRRARLSGPP